MPPRKSTSSAAPAETDEPSQLSPQVQSTADKPITATEQQIKARAELGVSVDVSGSYPHLEPRCGRVEKASRQEDVFADRKLIQ